MDDEKTIIELVDLATDERLKWLEHEQQKNDLEGPPWLGMSVLVGILFWLTVMLLTSGCTVNVYRTEYVDRELSGMSDGIHADDRIQLEKLINEK